MKVTAEKITGVGLLREANEFSMAHRQGSQMSLETAYDRRHSTIRTQIFIIRMYGIPYSAAMHLRTHCAVGQYAVIGSQRPDRGGEEQQGRDTKTDMMMILNSQHLEEMSWDRLCTCSEDKTRQVMHRIKQAVKEEDSALAKLMVPRCFFLNRCLEAKPCRKDMIGT